MPPLAAVKELNQAAATSRLFAWSKPTHAEHTVMAGNATIYNGCQVAILSAHDTNYDPHPRGEGVWELSCGFLVAGTRRVVASNWLVDDEAAASLISYSCSIIAKAEGAGKTPDYAEAFWKAKRWVRNNPDNPEWSNLYYWGTFVLVGPN